MGGALCARARGGGSSTSRDPTVPARLRHASSAAAPDSSNSISARLNFNPFKSDSKKIFKKKHSLICSRVHLSAPAFQSPPILPVPLQGIFVAELYADRVPGTVAWGLCTSASALSL